MEGRGVGRRERATEDEKKREGKDEPPMYSVVLCVHSSVRYLGGFTKGVDDKILKHKKTLTETCNTE